MEKQLLDGFLEVLKTLNNDFKQILKTYASHENMLESEKKIYQDLFFKVTDSCINRLYGALTLIVIVMGNNASDFTLAEPIKSYLTHETHPGLLEKLISFIVIKKEVYDNTAVRISQLSIWPHKVKSMFY